MSIAALIVAGGWAYFQFQIAETTASNIRLTVSMEVQRYSDDNRLLIVHVRPQNIGKVRVEPGRDGLVVVVRSIPTNARPGVLDLEKMPEVYRGDLMKRFPEGYEMEPGIEFDESVAIVVPKGAIYAAKATLDLGDDTEVDHTAVARTD